MDELIFEKKLYRLTGILYIKVFRRAKRMDFDFVPYWKIPFKGRREFINAKLLEHEGEADEFSTMDKKSAGTRPQIKSETSL
jgi:hypothetical protein